MPFGTRSCTAQFETTFGEPRHYFLFEVKGRYLHLPRLVRGCRIYVAEQETYNDGQLHRSGNVRLKIHNLVAPTKFG